MGKTLKVLENLQRAQEEEKRRIEEMHKKHLNELKESLLELSRNKLNTIYKDIQKTNKIYIQKTYRQVWVYGVISLLLGLIIGAIGGTIYEKRAIGRKNWILNKREWKYLQDESFEWVQREIKKERR